MYDDTQRGHDIPLIPSSKKSVTQYVLFLNKHIIEIFSEVVGPLACLFGAEGMRVKMSIVSYFSQLAEESCQVLSPLWTQAPTFE
jgi:hypothetical protein